jgi:16S rRNA G966 N2-methylase RsmD
LDTNYRAFTIIKQNLQATRLSKYAQVLKKDAFTFLREKPGQNFDFIYIAPPQYQDLWLKAVLLLDEHPDWICEDGEIIIQIHPKEYKSEIVYTNFRVFDQRNYGDTMLVFLERISNK